MKYVYKELKYQKDAVRSVIDVFKKKYSQPYQERSSYIMDMGKQEMDFSMEGYNNAEVTLNANQILENIHAVQDYNGLERSENLLNDMGHCSLDIEMETGTGKTFVYTKTIFELNREFGWTKFIIVVPSIAIREGVYASITDTVDYFQDSYGKKARTFIYNSANLSQLDSFSSDANINVMIINTQAFNASLKEGGTSKEARIIYSKRDEFASRRPIDVIAANRPIIIMDEPQKMGGDKTQSALKKFKPLFVLNYSATHAVKHNLIYKLDALDAYNEKLVKKIEVKGFKVSNLKGVDAYLYLNDVIVTPEGPKARIELEQRQKSSSTPKRIYMLLDSQYKNDLYALSGEMEQYKGYTITDVDKFTGKVTFLNGKELTINQIQGDVSEQDLRRIQIHETIKSHFEKERQNFEKGIKTLSLFFIDKVEKYRQYNDDGNEVLGEYGKMFEEEYAEILAEQHELFESDDYSKYLDEMCSDASKAHRGYFSIDKKSGHIKDSKEKESDDDISAYDLILKNKQRLMSFEEPTRFIFSHSALREGWDNPNVFQICTLKHSDSTTTKRQEIGRGLRLSVDKNLIRQDIQVLGNDIHKVNVLTIIASDSYNDFAADLQKEIESTLVQRVVIVGAGYFIGKTVNDNGEIRAITPAEGNLIYHYMVKADYLDFDNKITEKYHQDLENGTLAPMPEQLQSVQEDVQKYIQGIFDPSVFSDMIGDANKPKILKNDLNKANFAKFKELWDKINHKYSYTVQFDSDELIKNSVREINHTLVVSRLMYTVTTGIQKENMNEDELRAGKSFEVQTSDQKTINSVHKSSIKYDLVGKIAQGATITRKTAVAILKGITFEKLEMFHLNPEEFIAKVIEIILEQKSTIIVDHISYNQIEGQYDSDIFTAEKINYNSEKTFHASKAILDYINTDGSGADSVEMRFVKELDTSKNVCTYAKMPKGGYIIPTPVGNYSPDWAIVFEKGKVKHVFFVAETKGSMSSMQLKTIEQNKISCAEKLFKDMFKDESVVYHKVRDFSDLLTLAELK